MHEEKIIDKLNSMKQGIFIFMSGIDGTGFQLNKKRSVATPEASSPKTRSHSRT